MFSNIYFQAFLLSFFCVCIIRYVVVNILKSILKLASKIEFCEKYVYWFFPLCFSFILTMIKPIDMNFFVNLIVYYGVQLLIFNSLFKTIVIKIEEKIKKW